MVTVLRLYLFVLGPYEHVFIHLPATRQPCPHMLSFQLRLCLVLIIAQKSPWHQPSRSFSTTRRTSGIRSSSRLHLNASRNSKMVSTRVLDQAQLLCVSLVLCRVSYYCCYTYAPNLRVCANFATLPLMELVRFGMEGNLRWQCRGHACGPGA